MTRPHYTDTWLFVVRLTSRHRHAHDTNISVLHNSTDTRFLNKFFILEKKLNTPWGWHGIELVTFWLRIRYASILIQADVCNIYFRKGLAASVVLRSRTQLSCVRFVRLHLKKNKTIKCNGVLRYYFFIADLRVSTKEPRIPVVMTSHRLG